MRKSVRDYFIKFSEPFEGAVYHMYLDIKGLVSVGIGNLITPMVLGAGYPWRRNEDGKLASAQEYAYEWNLINSKPELAQEGWTGATRFCRLHLNPDDVATLCYAKMDSNELELRKRVPNFDEHCADVQLMLHSWAWAVGPDASYPRMLKLIVAKGYNAATSECDINPKVGTIILRNSANRQLLINATAVRDMGLDPDVLVYPGTGKSGLITMEGGEGQIDLEHDHTVVTLQHALSLLGFSISQDGKFGPETLEAVKRFQASRKLKVDGIVGPLTYAALQTALRFR